MAPVRGWMRLTHPRYAICSYLILVCGRSLQDRSRYERVFRQLYQNTLRFLVLGILT